MLVSRKLLAVSYYAMTKQFQITDENKEIKFGFVIVSSSFAKVSVL